MSDFLTRLVQRQRGELPTLAPLMRPAFSGATAPSNFEATEQAMLVRTKAKTDERVATPDDVEVSHADAPVHPTATENRKVPRVEPAPTREASAVFRPRLTENASAPSTPALLERRSTHESTVHESTRVEARTDQVSATVPTQTMTVDHRSPPSHVPAEPRVRHEPTRLVTPVSSGIADVSAPLAAPISVFERRAEPGRSRDEQPPSSEASVHVTIGRIEIAAIPAPAAPKRAPLSRKPAMSLNDYLARRRGDRT